MANGLIVESRFDRIVDVDIGCVVGRGHSLASHTVWLVWVWRIVLPEKSMSILIVVGPVNHIKAINWAGVHFIELGRRAHLWYDGEYYMHKEQTGHGCNSDYKDRCLLFVGISIFQLGLAFCRWVELQHFIIRCSRHFFIWEIYLILGFCASEQVFVLEHVW